MSEPTAESLPTVDSSEALASLTSAQRESWRLTGEMPAAEPVATDADPDTAEDDEPTVEAKAPEDAAPAQDEPKTDPEPPKKIGNPRKDREARMFQAIEREKAATLRAEAAERKAAELEARYSGQPPPAAGNGQPQAPAPAAPTGEPQIEHFLDQPDPYAALAKATAKWELAEFKRELEAKQQHETVMTHRRKIFEAAVAKYPAVAERLADPAVANLPIPQFMWDAIDRSPASAEILNFLSERPDEGRRLAALDPVAALLELGQFSAARPSSVPSPASLPSAPAPPTMLGSRPAQPEDAVSSAVAAGDFRRYKDAANRRELAGKR